MSNSILSQTAQGSEVNPLLQLQDLVLQLKDENTPQLIIKDLEEMLFCYLCAETNSKQEKEDATNTFKTLRSFLQSIDKIPQITT